MFQFLGSSIGRWVRALAGLILISLGLWVVPGIWQWVLILVGLIPLAAGVLDFCLFAPLFGLPFLGDQLRESVRDQ